MNDAKPLVADCRHRAGEPFCPVCGNAVPDYCSGGPELTQDGPVALPATTPAEAGQKPVSESPGVTGSTSGKGGKK